MVVSGELFGASGTTEEDLQIRLGTLLGLVCSLLPAEDGRGGAGAVFYLLSDPKNLLLLPQDPGIVPALH